LVRYEGGLYSLCSFGPVLFAPKCPESLGSRSPACFAIRCDLYRPSFLAENRRIVSIFADAGPNGKRPLRNSQNTGVRIHFPKGKPAQQETSSDFEPQMGPCIASGKSNPWQISVGMESLRLLSRCKKTCPSDHVQSL
jgi:hypothetical protein